MILSVCVNRILGMPVDLQNRLFKYFTDTLNAIITQAKKSGRFDMGILGKYCCFHQRNASDQKYLRCLEITNKFTNSYQFIISLSCSYTFLHLRECFSTCWATGCFGSVVDKILCSTWLYVYCVTVQMICHSWWVVSRSLVALRA
jgi:hypothetical protein